jgi:hypothetical protein
MKPLREALTSVRTDALLRVEQGTPILGDTLIIRAEIAYLYVTAWWQDMYAAFLTLLVRLFDRPE